MNALDQVQEFQRVFGCYTPWRAADPNLPPHVWDVRNKILLEEWNELITAYVRQDAVSILDALCDMQYILLGTVCAFGLQDMFDAAFTEVHRSNMSKLDTNGKPIYREDGKVLKGPNYSPPNLKQFIDRC